MTGRCIIIGKRVETEEIPAYCAVALAGIGDLPDTIGSRAIIIDMRRRAPDEYVEPFRPRIHETEGASIKTMIESWCAAQGPALATVQPKFPDGIADRDADCWEAMLAIADAAGEDWPQRARSAAVALVARGADRTRTAGVQLLADLREVFGGADKVATSAILDRLHNLPESAWRDIRGKALDDRGLARRLGKYGVKPKKLRPHPSAPAVRGYEAADLAEAWSRYLPSPQQAEQEEHAEQAEQGAARGAQKLKSVPSVPSVPPVADEADIPDDGDPFAAFHDPSLKLKLGG